jgi:fatty acid desaturase
MSGYNPVRSHIEWPSVVLLFLIYSGWLILTWFSYALPWWVISGVGAVLLAWHSSFQHELIHGHPTPWRHVNRALAFPPLSLWLPFELYRRSHLIHHRDERLTDPLDDPESYYWTQQQWDELGPISKRLVQIQTTLMGRLIIGPGWNILRFFKYEIIALIGGKRSHAGVWIRHGIGCVVILGWVNGVCGLSIWFYVLGVVYPGTALLLIRSFAEHRAADGVRQRTAIVENAGFFGLLFLYNNLHAAHHAEPMMPWYEIPAWYRTHRSRLIAENGGLVYNGYWDVARRYFFVGHDRPQHPTDRAVTAGVSHQ